ncbi:histidine phosphatase family protein [Nocardia farcinica]|uniref:Phosphoglyceromutase n=3 Tax=Nocardia TaxID=1817 RepID=A0A0H5NSR2_NOCFR|nr:MULTISPECIES: histidine phosphatase family protein [Nocardia]AXK85929.1 histidine phosphatase family protein [Nocardia farcinica]MBA4859327.1 histidine phosphatase family protein [Nocardia farcinica]MBC9816139.1 histidine phosphatase family protein [Nocardia farcinica]MBF6068272.1 histidine phosphatase family protein [Nocardia farcinica]MBF6140531.1 histidine phosphatase family protein [Nocardia farcinica]
MSKYAGVRTLILLRHGQTEWNATDRMQGQIDTDLTELGRRQAKEAARELVSRNAIAIVSSDLRRAHDTALALAEHTDVPVALDPRLRETHLGDWQGLTHLEVDADYPGARVAWRLDATYRPPGGESKLEVGARALPVVRELYNERQDWPGRTIILVAHGGLIAALTAALLELPPQNWPALGGLANTSWVQLSSHGPGIDQPGWRLDVWNAAAKVAPDVL